MQNIKCSEHLTSQQSYKNNERQCDVYTQIT